MIGALDGHTIGSKSGRHSLRNVEAREWYPKQEATIPDLLDKKLSLIEQAFSLRNQFRTQAKEWMEDRVLAKLLYGTEPNMTWEEMI